MRHSPLDKAQTIIASLVLGCAHTKAINDTLGEEEAAANYLGKERWPDQSQINRYLTRFTAANVDERGAVHEQALRRASRARQVGGLLVVDIDQCGLVANGQTYEFHRKGYFPHKRGDEGYQLSLAYSGAYEEAVALYLDPGNVHCKGRLHDLLRATDRLFGPQETAVELLRRLDAGYDNAANRVMLAALPGYVLLKGAQPDLAAHLAQRIPLQHWLPLADDVHGAEVAPTRAACAAWSTNCTRPMAPWTMPCSTPTCPPPGPSATSRALQRPRDHRSVLLRLAPRLQHPEPALAEVLRLSALRRAHAQPVGLDQTRPPGPARSRARAGAGAGARGRGCGRHGQRDRV